MEQFDILIKLRKILRSINLESKRIEKSHGITIPQLLTLQFLKSQENYRSTASEIKNHLNLNASTVTGILHRLETKNWVAKAANAADKRSSKIFLTGVGLEFLTHAPETIQERIALALNQMDASVVKDLEHSLDTLIALVDIDELDADQTSLSGEQGTHFSF